MPKPPPRRVPSDDAVVTIDGTTYNPHEGEWVEVVGSASIAELKSLWAFDRVSVEIEDLEGKPDEGKLVAAKLDEYYDDLCAWIARRLVDWNWTDDQGRPLPKPDGTIKPIQALRGDEVYYLRKVLRGEGPADRLNGSTPSPNTSSGTDSAETPTEPISTTAPSRTKS